MKEFEAVRMAVEVMNKEGVVRKDFDQVVKKSFIEIMEVKKRGRRRNKAVERKRGRWT